MRGVDLLDDLVAGLVGSLLESTLGQWLGQRSNVKRLRGWARAFEEGRDVAFAGWAEGPVAYASRFGGGMLVLRAGALFWVADLQLGPSFWHRIPNERLVAQERKEVTFSGGPEIWPGYECLDGGKPVVLVCEPDAERYLRAALALPESGHEPFIDARTDRPSEAADASAPNDPEATH